jgi:serine/alanine adding enzyme
MSTLSPLLRTSRLHAAVAVRVCQRAEISSRIADWTRLLQSRGEAPLSLHPAWTDILCRSLGHEPFVIEARTDATVRGFLPLALVKSWLFGRFLVSLPFLNYGGPSATSEPVETALLDQAVELANALRVRFLEIRATRDFHHAALPNRLTSKVHMRLPLPESSAALWKQFDPKVRNQIRKGEKNELSVHWGRLDLLPEFYSVFSRNMRDLGTPVYGRRLFEEILNAFPERAEICVVRQNTRAIASALLLHGWGVTEVPCASSLREANPLNGNMLMYSRLLQRAIERRQAVFDFGRSTLDSNTYRFKKQWGAAPAPAVWQYHVRHGDLCQMRPDNARFSLLRRIWRKLPLTVAGLLGPRIVRGIP